MLALWVQSGLLAGASPASIVVTISASVAGSGGQAATVQMRPVVTALTAGGGAQFGLGTKVGSAVSVAGAAAGAGYQGATLGKRATVSVASAGAPASSEGAKKRSAGVASVTTGGAGLTVSQRRATALVFVGGSGSQVASTSKRISATARVSGGGYQITGSGLPALADIAAIAGVWLRSIGIDGVIAGGVTIAGTFDVMPASGGLIDQPEAIDGVVNPIVRIDGRRTVI